MNKIIFRSLIVTLLLLVCFIIYLGSTEAVIEPKLIERELILDDK